MTRVGVVVRWLMLVACLVPFTSPRQASGTVPTPTAPLPLVPIGGQEDDTEREEEVVAKQATRAQHPVAHRASAASRPNARLLTHQLRITSHVRVPSPLDPFRNGLGSPYRC